jgi:SAM-dependent methyltransferase
MMQAAMLDGSDNSQSAADSTSPDNALSDDSTKSYTPINEQVELLAPARTAEDVRARHQSNRAAWNEAAARYSEGLARTIADLQAGKSNLHPIERENFLELGALADWCEVAVHVQCASGEDTLSLWLEGAHMVIGIDIADDHIVNAKATSDALNAPATWYCCDVLDIPAELDGCADLVYTGRGAINWLQDLTSWGQVIARLLKPGGVMHIFDGHPAMWLFEPDAERLEVARGTNYFEHSERNQGWGAEYIGDLGKPTDQLTHKYERLWTLADVFTALTKAGLVVDLFQEHSEDYWNSMPNLNEDEQRLIPRTFAMQAYKPNSK